jgi:hypothetical protein
MLCYAQEFGLIVRFCANARQRVAKKVEIVRQTLSSCTLRIGQ